MGVVLYEQAGAVATIRMNRPDRLNAYNFEMGEGLLRAATEAAFDPRVRCIVLAGTGKAFSAGGDVAFFGTLEDGDSRPFLDLTIPLHAFIVALRRAPKPVVSAVNGVAAGAGFSMALAGDVVVAAGSARFALAYQNIGLSPDGGASFFLARAVGTHRAMELTLFGRTLTAEEAFAWGLVQKVLPDDGFDGAVFALAERIATGPTAAYSRAKALYNAAVDRPLEAHLEEERQNIAAGARSHDFREGVRAFLMKRPPNFEGR